MEDWPAVEDCDALLSLGVAAGWAAALLPEAGVEAGLLSVCVVVGCDAAEVDAWEAPLSACVVLVGCEAVLPPEAGVLLAGVVCCAGVLVLLEDELPLDEAVEEAGVVVELAPELPVPLDEAPLDDELLDELWLELGIE